MALKKCLEEKEKRLREFRQKLEKPGSTIEDENVVKSGKETLNVCAQEKACRKYIEKAKSEHGALSLKHHASRHLSTEKLSSRVVLHNYFSKRKNGTTAAERFFHQKPKDIFDWLLERVSWPVRPRSRGRKMEAQTCSAASSLTHLELVA